MIDALELLGGLVYLLVAGDFDYFLKMRARDTADLSRRHAEDLLRLPGVRQTRTFLVMKEVVEGAPLDF